MARFAYDPEIIARYPTIVGGVLHVPAVVNGPSSPELLAASQAEQSATLQRIGDTPLSEIPSLQAQPDVEVELKDGIRRVRGHAATGDERERLLELWRQFGDYDAYAVRRPTETAIVVLETRARSSTRPDRPAPRARAGCRARPPPGRACGRLSSCRAGAPPHRFWRIGVPARRRCASMRGPVGWLGSTGEFRGAGSCV